MVETMSLVLFGITLGIVGFILIISMLNAIEHLFLNSIAVLESDVETNTNKQ